MQISERVMDIAISQLAEGGKQISEAFGNVIPGIWDAVKFNAPRWILGDMGAGIVMFDSAVSALLKPLQTMAQVTATLPARIGLAVILEYGAGDLFPDVKRSRVLTEQDAAAETVRQVCLAGLEAGGFSIKATSAIGMLMAATESAAGGRGRLALLLTGRIGKFVSKAVGSRLKAVVLLAVDGLLRAAFATSCLFLVLWLVQNWSTRAALPQDNPRISLFGKHRERFKP